MRSAALFSAFLCLLIVTTAPAALAAEKRVALVIGNSAYQHTPKLENPKNDAVDVAAALTKLGFTVIEGTDLDKQAMDRKIRDFAEAIGGADVGVMFYAGHGLQVGGQNYLVPVDAKLPTPGALDFEMVRLELIQRSMERETKTNIVFLDACRDNPLARNLARAKGTRSVEIGRGLATVESGTGTLISFSTQPGNVALDGEGRNSPYAAAVVKQIASPGVDIGEILVRVRRDVMASTQGRQVPWEHSALTGKFYFTPPAAVVSAPDAARSAPQPGLTYEQQMELALWNRVKDSKDPAELQAYVDQFPQGVFVSLARVLIERAKGEEARRIAALREQLLEEARKKAEGANKTAERDRVEKQAAAANPTVTAPVRELERPPAAKPAPAPPAPSVDTPTSPTAARPALAPPAPPVDTRTSPKGAVAAVAPPPSTGPEPGALRDCTDCPVLVRVPAGSFIMGQAKGDPSAAPQRTVTVRAFAIGRHPITVGEWKACVAGGGCSFTPRMTSAEDRTPVHNVSWDDAQQFIQWLSRSAGRSYRLPTEAEWEYAARANTSTRYWWGDNAGAAMANCTDCGGSQDPKTPLSVGSFKPNPFGIHDVHGGVAQWVADCWFPNHQGAPADASARDQKNCQKRVLRGGSFRNDREAITAAARGNYDASVRYIAHGFRVVRDLN